MTSAATGTSRRRAVLLIANAAAPYSRGLRVARSLATAGWEVEIAAVAEPGVPVEERDGDVLIRRYPRSGWPNWLQRALPPRGRGGRLRRVAARALDVGVKVPLWPFPVRGWWATLRRDLPPADLYHAFGILTIPVAIQLGRDARRHGRRGIVVYDVIDAILDSNNYSKVPAPVLSWYRWKEAQWVRKADGLVTVNEALAEHCASIWPRRQRPTVVMNCQPRWTPPRPRPDLIREAVGLPSERRIVLFLGRLGPQRGLAEAAEAVLRLDDAALVMLGFGPWADELRTKDRAPRFVGRHVTLPPVHPDDVKLWAASADVSVLAVPANSLNQRLSTPNKFWESLVAGTPVVVGRDLDVARNIVERYELGASADPSDIDDIVRGLRDVLEQPADAYEAMRERCVEACRNRYNWETEASRLVSMYEGLLERG